MDFTKEKSLSFENEQGPQKDSVLSLLPETNKFPWKDMQDPDTIPSSASPTGHLGLCLLLRERTVMSFIKFYIVLWEKSNAQR